MNELEMSDLTGIDDDRILKDPECLIPVPATGCTPLQPVRAAFWTGMCESDRAAMDVESRLEAAPTVAAPTNR